MKKNTVQFFRPAINFIMNHTRGIIGGLLLIVVIMVSPVTYRVVGNFFELQDIPISKFQELSITGILTSLLPILYAWLARLYKDWKRSIIKLKRVIYRYFYYLSISVYIPKWIQKIVLLIIQVFYYQKREPLIDQQLVVNKILGEMNSHAVAKEINRVFWIQGSPYSGKTTTILNLFVDLISKKEYEDLFGQLDGKIVYLDLGRDDFNFEQLLNNYNLGRYENHLLVLDNLHKISSTNCFTVIHKIILNMQTFAIIVLMRKPSDFLTDTNQIVKLAKIMVDTGITYILPSVSKQDFSSYGETEFGSFCEQFNLFIDDYGNDAVIVHLSSLYVRRKTDYYNFLPKIHAFLRRESTVKEFDNKLAAIVSASLFSGSFSIEVLDKCCASTSSEWKSFLHRLLDVGFLINYPDSSKKYYHFHENLAKFYFEKSYSSPYYKNLYLKYFQRLCDYYLNTQNELLTFLYSVLPSLDNQYQYLFDEIVINANFVNLYGEIDFLLKQDEAKRIKYYRELGILCDRMGELQEAKGYYLKYLDTTQNIDAFYKLVQIDHDYINDYPKIARESEENQDIYYVLLHHYWQQHIHMHDGQFDFNSYKQIIDDGQKYCVEILYKHPYDGLHLLRRLYFDLFRVYYLAGILNPSELKNVVRRGNPLKECLSAKLDEFEAYYIKFAVAQFLGQDVLFTLAFLSKSISKDDYNLILKDQTNIQYEELHDIVKIAREAVQLYNISIHMLEQIGDKTAMFVRYHMYGTKLVLVNNGDFSECEQFYEEYMGFATRENDVEYQSYAELYKLKMLMIKMCSPAIIGSSISLKELANQAEKKIHLTRSYQRLCNKKNGNSYAEIRLDLYETTLDYLCKRKNVQQFKSAILKIKGVAEDKKYHRERIVITYMEERQFQLSVEDIRIIITYYPIITQ